MSAWPSRPTLLYDISAADYHGDIWGTRERPTFSRSIAVKLLQQSPKHAYAAHPKLGNRPFEDDDEEPEEPAEKESKKDRDEGSLYHSLLLGGGNGFEIVEGFNDWRKDAAKEKRDAAKAAGLIPVLAHHWQGMRRVADHMRVGLSEAGISLADCDRETVALWESEIEPEDPKYYSKIRCKAMLDLTHFGDNSRTTITDVKVVKQINGNAFVRSMDRYGLDTQSSLYVEALEAIYPNLAGRVKFQFALVEKKPPYDVAVIEADKMLLAIGSMKLRVARARWARCLATNAWPGVGHFYPHIQPYVLNDAVQSFVQEFGTDALPGLEVGE